MKKQRHRIGSPVKCEMGIKREKCGKDSTVEKWVQCLLSSLQCDCLTPTSFIHPRSKNQNSL